jgi:hypothetical protein
VGISREGRAICSSALAATDFLVYVLDLDLDLVSVGMAAAAFSIRAWHTRQSTSMFHRRFFWPGRLSVTVRQILPPPNSTYCAVKSPLLVDVRTAFSLPLPA